jgi:hypothetical protein
MLIAEQVLASGLPTSLDDAKTRLARIAREAGFDHFAYVGGQAFNTHTGGHGIWTRPPQMLIEYPNNWAETYHKQDFGTVDPVLATNTQETRTRAIMGFLDAARQRLLPYNVFLAVDVFGYVCWNVDDTHIGQRLEDIMPQVDYISPMLYPSGFQFGIPGYPNPVAHVYEVVRRSLDRVRERTHAPPVRVRPWLQAFKDYAFDHRDFGADEIRQQIRAAEEFGTDGWMLWNPRNVYSGHGLEPKAAAGR